MFKRIRENEKLQKAKEFWKNPKTHDIAVLAFWLIFIAVVILLIRSTSLGGSANLNAEKKTSLNNFDAITSYEFTYKTKDNIINGQAYNDAILFYLNNNRYYYKENVYLIEDEPAIQSDFDLKVLKINNKFLKNLTSGIIPLDNDNFKQYIIPLDRFINLFEANTTLDLTKAATYNITLSVYLKDDIINKVILDLTSYNNLKNNNQDEYPVTINYYNVNNVSDFTKGYDKIVEVVK